MRAQGMDERQGEESRGTTEGDAGRKRRAHQQLREGVGYTGPGVFYWRYIEKIFEHNGVRKILWSTRDNHIRLADGRYSKKSAICSFAYFQKWAKGEGEFSVKRHAQRVP